MSSSAQEDDEIHSLVAAYALDALEPDELRRYERHLAGCERCREQADALREAAAALAYAGATPEPRQALRGRILERAREERGRVVPFRRRFAFPAMAAVAAVAAVALGLWASSLSGSLDRERSAREAQSRALGVVAQAGARRFPLAGAQGMLVVAPSGRAALVVERLGPAPRGRTYEIWVVRGARPEPAGLFPGGDRSVVGLTRPVPRGARVAVTLERSGGAPSPTGRPLFGAQNL